MPSRTITTPDTGRARLRCSSNSMEFRTASERRFPLSKRIYSQRKKKKTRSSYGFESIARGKIEPTARQNPHPLQKRKTQRVRHPQIPSVPSVDVRCLVEGSATRPSTELEGCATRQRKKKKTPSKLWVRINLKGEDRADRASKPAPFAEKKNAKSAAPANSIGAFG